MSEQEPYLIVRFENGEFQANRENTTLYTFYGHAAMFNHVFMQTGEEDEESLGAYIFESTQPVAYAQLGQFIVRHEFPMILNRVDVPDCDRDAWNRAQESLFNEPEQGDEPRS